MRPGNPEALSLPYDPSRIEPERYAFWERLGVFQPRADLAAQPKGTGAKAPFVIVMPPPNVTGALHIGHALTDTVEDMHDPLAPHAGARDAVGPGHGPRRHRHAERGREAAAPRRRSRHDLGREEFVKRVWEWKAAVRRRSSQQQRRLGASPDWSRERFTLDEGYSRAVRTCSSTCTTRG